MKHFKVSIILILIFNNVLSQNVTISGYVGDYLTKEKLIDAMVILNKNIIYTNEFGFYSITVSKNQNIEIKYKYLGYKDTLIKIYAENNKRIDILLFPENEISKIEVAAQKKSLHYNDLSQKQIKLIPCLVGEQDVLKAFQSLPGVQFGTEGTSNLYVRGGTPDQNLIIIDDIPIRYTEHFGGFVSVVDVNAINKIKLFKSGFPLKYGSANSSILDIRIKDGNSNKIQSEIYTGFISSKLSINGPIVKDKITFISTFRVCNIGAFTSILHSISPDVFNFQYYFYDFNFKTNYKINPKNKIDFTFYIGKDIAKSSYSSSYYEEIIKSDTIDKEESNTYWGNIIGSLRWTHSFSNKLFMKYVMGFTQYKYLINGMYNIFNQKNNQNYYSYSNLYCTNVQDILLKFDFDYFINSTNNLNFGFNIQKSFYSPGNLSIQTTSEYFTNVYTKNYSMFKPININIFSQYFFKLSNKINCVTGFLINNYLIYNYHKVNWALSAKINIEIGKLSTLSTNFDRTFQNQHLLTNRKTLTPADIWIAATKNIPSEFSYQYSVDYSYSNAKLLDFSFSIFLKQQKNLIELNRMAYLNDTLNAMSIENIIIAGGLGDIYGVETMFNKRINKFFLQFAYTLMYNNRKFSQINNGRPFPFTFDRRHYFQSIINFEINKNLNIQAFFIFSTGYPATIQSLKQKTIIIEEPGFENFLKFPVNQNYIQKIDYEKNEILIASSLNNLRMPCYHRLDLSLNWVKEKKKGTRTWSLNIYNVYNHHNAYFLLLTKYKNEKNLSLVKFTLFPIIPSISYSFKFK